MNQYEIKQLIDEKLNEKLAPIREDIQQIKKCLYMIVEVMEKNDNPHRLRKIE